MITFMCQNLIYNSTLTPSTVNAQYPVSNLKNDFRTKVWRSTSNSDNLVIDLGSTEDIDSICVSPNWQDGFGVTAITIQGNATDSWGSPAFSEAMTLDTTFGHAISVFSSTQSYRFWRLVVTSTLGYCELANIYIGAKTELTTNGVGYNWSYSNKDLVRSESTIYGQEYFDDYGTRKELSGLSFEVMNPTEIDKIFEISDNCRTIKPFWVKFGTGTQLLNDDDRVWGMYKLTGEPSFTNFTSGFYNVSLGVREQK